MASKKNYGIEEHLYEMLLELFKLECSTSFRYAVDPYTCKCPTYYDVIKEPMDLSTLKENLKDGLYKTLNDVKVQVERIVSNCRLFNGPLHPITKKAEQLGTSFTNRWNNIQKIRISMGLPEDYELKINKDTLKVIEDRKNTKKESQSLQQGYPIKKEPEPYIRIDPIPQLKFTLPKNMDFVEQTPIQNIPIPKEAIKQIITPHQEPKPEPSATSFKLPPMNNIAIPQRIEEKKVPIVEPQIQKPIIQKPVENNIISIPPSKPIQKMIQEKIAAIEKPIEIPIEKAIENSLKPMDARIKAELPKQSTPVKDLKFVLPALQLMEPHTPQKARNKKVLEDSDSDQPRKEIPISKKIVPQSEEKKPLLQTSQQKNEAYETPKFADVCPPAVTQPVAFAPVQHFILSIDSQVAQNSYKENQQRKLDKIKAFVQKLFSTIKKTFEEHLISSQAYQIMLNCLCYPYVENTKIVTKWIGSEIQKLDFHKIQNIYRYCRLALRTQKKLAQEVMLEEYKILEEQFYTQLASEIKEIKQIKQQQHEQKQQQIQIQLQLEAQMRQTQQQAQPQVPKELVAITDLKIYATSEFEPQKQQQEFSFDLLNRALSIKRAYKIKPQRFQPKPLEFTIEPFEYCIPKKVRTEPQKIEIESEGSSSTEEIIFQGRIEGKQISQINIPTKLGAMRIDETIQLGNQNGIFPELLVQSMEFILMDQMNRQNNVKALQQQKNLYGDQDKLQAQFQGRPLHIDEKHTDLYQLYRIDNYAELQLILKHTDANQIKFEDLKLDLRIENELNGKSYHNFNNWSQINSRYQLHIAATGLYSLIDTLFEMNNDFVEYMQDVEIQKTGCCGLIKYPIISRGKEHSFRLQILVPFSEVNNLKIWMNDQAVFPKTLVTVIPSFVQGQLNFISGNFGPFKINVPTQVPLWLAIHLKKANRCRIQMPAWLNVQKLTEVLTQEKDNTDDLCFIDDNYYEIALILLTHCKEDMSDDVTIRSLIEDIHSLRENKIFNRVKLIVDQDVIKINNISQEERNKIMSTAYGFSRKLKGDKE